MAVWLTPKMPARSRSTRSSRSPLLWIEVILRDGQTRPDSRSILGSPTMRPDRGTFLGTALGAGVSVAAAGSVAAGDDRRDPLRRLDELAAAPVLRVDGTDRFAGDC